MDEKRKPSFLNEEGNIPLLPLRDIVIFPGMLSPLFVGRKKSISAVEKAIDDNNSIILLSAQKSAGKEEPGQDDIYDMGCICEIVQIFKMPDGTVKIMVEGIARASIAKYISTEPFFIVKADADKPRQVKKLTPELEALSRRTKSAFGKYLKIENKVGDDIFTGLDEVKDLEKLSDMIMAHLLLKTKNRQKILSELNLKTRLETINSSIESELEILQIEKKVKGHVKKQMDQSQKEYYLNEQIKAIQKELGRTDSKSDIQELKEKILTAGMPKETETKAIKEVLKLEQMPQMSAEGTVVRNYLDWLIDIPWDRRSDDNLELSEAEKILNQDHYGLEDVKNRILEYLSVKQLSKTGKGPILCIVGPPGVGKTSLGKSIARAMGRKFVRVSLGGIRDEAEIRGHRRTYIGALPGRIIQSMKKAGTVNPVMMLDEIDKMTSDFRGDPSSALLEVLDPEQNKNFSDHYLEVDYDLSEVVFVTTANILDPIPIPLLDRMEVLQISGYTEQEKLKIAKNFLIPKQVKEHGLLKKQLELADETIKQLIAGYTREAGVRGLERVIASVCRKVVRNVVEKKEYEVKPDSKEIVKLLGAEKYRKEKAEEHNETGFALGMAWTQTGGVIMNIEVSVVPGKGKLILTGKLGDVMQESGQAALSYIRSRTELLGLDKDFYSKSDVHIHVPEGATPKDGPSAGITMVTAMVSAFCNIPVRHDIAMTGEVTLRGRVLPIGGLKEKVLAAHRAGIKEIIFPSDNKKDLEKFPKNILKEIRFTPVKSMDEVLAVALTSPSLPNDKKTAKNKKTSADQQPGMN